VRRLVLRLSAAEDGSVSVAASLDGQAAARADGLALEAGLEAAYRTFLMPALPGARGPGDALAGGQEQALVTLGQALGELVFAGDVAACVAGQVPPPVGQLLELVYESDAPGLLALPFEAARLPDGRAPALEAGVTVLRRPPGGPAAGMDSPAGPLKILVAVGAPDEGLAGGSPLDLEAELQTILDAVEPVARLGNAEVRVLEVGHPEEIRRALAADTYHVLHLSGHGAPGALELEDEDGRAVPTTARDLADCLRPAGRPVPLVFLSACHGGVAAGESAGLAQELLQAGLPMVLAMQTRVTDGYATSLAGRFYAELAGDRPLASRALAEARRQQEQERRSARQRGAPAGEVQPEYATAALFCAGEERPLLDPGRPPERLRAPPVYRVPGPVPQLGLGELVNRREELREVLWVLRDDPRSVEALGRKAGVVLTGIGGVGKSALAGRAMTRMRERGWLVAATTGVFSVGGIAAALAGALDQLPPASRDPRWDQLGAAELDDASRLKHIQAVLATAPALLVLDNFEDNLATGGGDWTDPTVRDLFGLLCESAERGKLLVTSRHPLPGFKAWLARVAVGPLSGAQTRKLLQRLPGLSDQPVAAISVVHRRIGGHPRMLEYLDGILRNGAARLPRLAARLEAQASRAGIDLEETVDTLDEAIRRTVILGARDVLLDDLTAIAEAAGDLEVLQQTAVSNQPVDAAGVAHMLHGEPAEDGAVQGARRSLGRLVDLSLVTRIEDDWVWVHRWTADYLRDRPSAEAHQARCRRAGDYRLWRVLNETHAPDDGREAVRNYLDGRAFDEAVWVTLELTSFLMENGQTAAAAALASEVTAELPVGHGAYAAVLDVEASALFNLGFSNRALERYGHLVQVQIDHVAAEPDRADQQRNLAMSYQRLGDLYHAMGQSEAALAAYQQALGIAEELVEAAPEAVGPRHDLARIHSRLGQLYRALGQGEAARSAFRQAMPILTELVAAEPERAEALRDLSSCYLSMGDLQGDLGQHEAALVAYRQSLEIVQRLAEAEPDRADLQRDLSVSYNRVGELYRALGRAEEAREAFEKDLAIAERLAEADPDRSDYQLDLSVSYERMGDLDRDQGQPQAAYDAYQQALAIRLRLTEADPHRADMQRSLSVSYHRLGDLLRSVGQDEAALAYHERDLAIAERLAAADPDRADYQRDLSVSYSRMGDLLSALGEAEAARDYYTRDLAITERLAESEPERADYQVDLVVSLARQAEYVPEEREACLRRGLAILRQLQAEGRLMPDKVGWIDHLAGTLAADAAAGG
jgi:tetratricopeptide (TPR) repeat protein